MKKEEFKCFWCNDNPATRGWACERCYPIKESAYKRCKKKGIKNWFEIMREANNDIKKAGIKFIN